MSYNKGLTYSLLIHLSIILLMAVKIRFFSHPEINLSQAIRVDMVGLPEKYNNINLSDDTPQDKPSEVALEAKTNELPEKIIEQPPQNEKVKPDTKSETKSEKVAKADADTINLKNSKQKQKAALDKLKQIAALDKIKQDLNSQKKGQSTSNAPIKGRIISKGTSLTGLDKLQSDGYLLKLDGLIKSHWQLPQWLIGKPLKTKILVKLEENGTIASKKIFQSSGNPTYDDFCLQAIDRASPFPKVPEKFTEVYKEDGVLIGFPE